MSTTLTYTSLNTQAPWPALLTQQLDHWHSLTAITSAEIVLEHQRDSARAFHVKVRLDGPSPALHTNASDATLEGALLKATQDLERQIQARAATPLPQARTTRLPDAIPDGGPVVVLGGHRKSPRRVKPIVNLRTGSRR